MLLQKLGNASVCIDLILDSGESMPLVFVNLEFHDASALLDYIRHLLGFRFGTAWIVSTGEQQDRSLHPVDEVNRAAILP